MAWAIGIGDTKQKNLDMGEEKRTYHMAFLDNGDPRSYLVEGCPGRAEMRMAMRVHFLHRHILDTVVILEERNSPTHGAPDATFWSPGVH